MAQSPDGPIVEECTPDEVDAVRIAFAGLDAQFWAAVRVLQRYKKPTCSIANTVKALMAGTAAVDTDPEDADSDMHLRQLRCSVGAMTHHRPPARSQQHVHTLTHVSSVDSKATPAVTAQTHVAFETMHNTMILQMTHG